MAKGNPHPTNRTPPASGRWKKGQSGNPSGLSRLERYRKAVDAALKLHDPSKQADKTRVKIASVQVGLCLAGDMTAIKDFNEREYGKVAQAITNDEETGQPFVVRWLKPGEEA
jgi:hypothetical protein